MISIIRVSRLLTRPCPIKESKLKKSSLALLGPVSLVFLGTYLEVLGISPFESFLSFPFHRTRASSFYLPRTEGAFTY